MREGGFPGGPHTLFLQKGSRTSPHILPVNPLLLELVSVLVNNPCLDHAELALRKRILGDQSKALASLL